MRTLSLAFKPLTGNPSTHSSLASNTSPFKVMRPLRSLRQRPQVFSFITSTPFPSQNISAPFTVPITFLIMSKVILFIPFPFILLLYHRFGICQGLFLRKKRGLVAPLFQTVQASSKDSRKNGFFPLHQAVSSALAVRPNVPSLTLADNVSLAHLHELLVIHFESIHS